MLYTNHAFFISVYGVLSAYSGVYSMIARKCLIRLCVVMKGVEHGAMDERFMMITLSITVNAHMTLQSGVT